MVRRDYILRMVAEMAQVLARVVSLKSRREYEQALHEIDRALRDLREGGAGAPNDVSLEDWIALCRKHEHAASGLRMAVADLLREQGELLATRGDAAGAHRARTLALGLFLEGLLNGDTFVTAELLDKVDGLFDAVRESLSQPDVWRRMVHYLEARGRFAAAEDALFAWRDTGDPAARAEAGAFYERLLALDDGALERGNLPRSEIEEARREL
jgi:hypothetical protein